MSNKNPSFATRVAPAVAIAGVGFVLVNALDKPATTSASQSTDTTAAAATGNTVATNSGTDSSATTVPPVQAPANTQAATPQTAAPQVTTAPQASASGTGAATTSSACGAVVSQGSTENITERRTYGTIVVTAKFDGAGTLCKVSANYQVWDNRSQRIEDYVVPILDKQAVAAGSANVNGVSGATAVTNAFANSLQYAIDHKG